jgi:hypothetical protein
MRSSSWDYFTIKNTYEILFRAFIALLWEQSVRSVGFSVFRSLWLPSLIYVTEFWRANAITCLILTNTLAYVWTLISGHFIHRRDQNTCCSFWWTEICQWQTVCWQMATTCTGPWEGESTFLLIRNQNLFPCVASCTFVCKQTGRWCTICLLLLYRNLIQWNRLLYIVENRVARERFMAVAISKAPTTINLTMGARKQWSFFDVFCPTHSSQFEVITITIDHS